MAHQYLQPILVTARSGRPLRFTWREMAYTVVEILSTWRLSDRWWESAAHPHGASDRHYYRLRCEDGLLCEVYYDAAQQVWILDRVHD
jgi:Domain of unknown function (DUF6504)